jgi:type IV pilus assembly protein PilM
LHSFLELNKDTAMAFSFFNSATASKKRDQMISIDLGGRVTKAVYLQRKGQEFVLSRYALLDAPIYEKNLPADLLSEHLKNIHQALEARTRQVALAIGVNDSVVRQTEMPQIPINDMRQVLKNNSKSYLQQDLQGHVFDCYVIPSRQPEKAGDKSKGSAVIQKVKVLVASAKKQLVDEFQTAIRNSGLAADHIVPGVIGPINAFEKAMPEVFFKEVVALVDIGFKNSTICLLQDGELILTRVVAIGGDKFTQGLADAMNISYAEAEGIKVGMPGEVQSNLEVLVAPLGRELRASIDFFEHQQDRLVAHIFISGGSSRSDSVVQTLQTELGVECKTWNPASFLQLSLPPQQAEELPQRAAQLTVAIGTAMAAF